MLLRKAGIFATLLLLLGSGCKDGAQSSAAAAPVEKDPAASAPAQAPQAAPEAEEDDGFVGVSGRHRSDENDWVPAEFKRGMTRWKDTGVYVDGEPRGFLSFGELPIRLKPVWVEEEASIPIKPGHKGPTYKIIKQRHYRFTDYLRAIGVDVRKIKELHVYGPKFSETIVVSGDELRSRTGRDFLFRFGGEVWGKAIPRVPDDFGNGKSPDKISGVMVYIDKKPPTLVWNKGMELDGEIIKDVPYYGEPLRGGIRVYHDDRLVAIIKRRLLEGKDFAETTPEGEVRWKLFPFLESQGVDTEKIAEAWVIHGHRRQVRIGRDELVDATFQASPQGRGEILLGEGKHRTHVLALHSRPLKKSQLPVILPDEE